MELFAKNARNPAAHKPRRAGQRDDRDVGSGERDWTCQVLKLNRLCAYATAYLLPTSLSTPPGQLPEP